MSTRKSSSFWCYVLLIVVLVAGLSRPAAAQKCWSATGATATVSLSDLSYALQGNSVALGVLSTAPFPFVLDARYSVSGIDDDTGTSPKTKILWVGYHDNGLEAQVKVMLRQLEISTGTVTEIIPFDSNAPGLPQNGGQFQGVYITPCTIGGGFSSVIYDYFLKVELTRSGSGGNPVLYRVQVCEVNC
jgi:hypothetical protein